MQFMFLMRKVGEQDDAHLLCILKYINWCSELNASVPVLVYNITTCNWAKTTNVRPSSDTLLCRMAKSEIHRQLRCDGLSPLTQRLNHPGLLPRNDVDVHPAATLSPCLSVVAAAGAAAVAASNPESLTLLSLNKNKEKKNSI